MCQFLDNWPDLKTLARRVLEEDKTLFCAISLRSKIDPRLKDHCYFLKLEIWLAGLLRPSTGSSLSPLKRFTTLF